MDTTVAEIATRQQGMITWAQLRASGMSRHSIAERVKEGWLVPRHRAVYRFGTFAGPFGDEMAALLACGPRAVISHRSSAFVFVLCGRGRLVDVSIPDGIPRHRRGIRAHRATALAPGDVVLKHGLRLTTPARTLLDLAGSSSRAELERLIEEAQVQNVVSTAELLAIVERGAGRPGVRKLRAVVDLLDEPLLTRSEAERRLIALCRSAALPMPQTNVQRAGWEVDAVWDAQRLVVEVDGYKFHSPRTNFERDRRKDADLMLAGYRVLRITWRRLVREPDQVIAILAAALHAGVRATPGPRAERRRR